MQRPFGLRDMDFFAMNRAVEHSGKRLELRPW
jgi:hypothetical protein